MSRSCTRAEQRKHRLLELENEQRLEEFEALKMTDEQRRTLLRPFASVKFEFSDLDGLRWTSSALHRRQVHQPQRPDAPQKRLHRATTSTAFVVLTNADLAAFSGEDTIRVSVTSVDHRNGKRSRSPLKGLFPEKNTPASSSAGFPAWYTAGKRPYNEGHDSEAGLHPDDDEGIDHELDLDDSAEGDLTIVAESVDLDLDLEFDEDRSDGVQQYPHSFVESHTPFPRTSSPDVDAAGQQHTFTDLYPKRPPSRMDLYYDQ